MQQEQGGAQNQEERNGVPNDQGEGRDEEARRLVSPDDHKRALDDLHKFKNRTKESEAQIAKLSQSLQKLQVELENERRSKLEDKQDYKSLYETEKQMRHEKEQELKDMFDRVKYSEKFKAASQALTKAGLRPDAMKILERDSLDELQVGTANGRFVVDGVDTFVDRFKSEFDFAFLKEDVKINAGGGGAGNTTKQTLTPEYMVELEVKDPKKFKELLPEYYKQREERRRR